MWLTLRNPVWVFIGLLQPILYLVLFGPLLKSVASAPGFPQGGAYNVFVPGLLIQLAMFGLFVGFGLIAELRYGVVERMRVTPMSRTAMLLGRSLRDVVMLLVQALIMIVLAIPFGLHIEPFHGIVCSASPSLARRPRRTPRSSLGRMEPPGRPFLPRPAVHRARAPAQGRGRRSRGRSVDLVRLAARADARPEPAAPPGPERLGRPFQPG